MVPRQTLDKKALGQAVKAVYASPPPAEPSPRGYPSVEQIALAIEAYLAALGDGQFRQSEEK